MARFNEELRIHGVADVVIGGEEEPGSITPVQRLRRILDRQQFNAINAHPGQIIQMLKNNFVKGTEFHQRSVLTGIRGHPLDRHLVNHNLIVLRQADSGRNLAVPTEGFRYSGATWQ